MSRKPSPRAYPLASVGISFAALAHLNGITPRWSRRLRARALDDDQQGHQPTLEDAVAMAQLRAPRSHLSYWSRLAMAHYRRQGLSDREVALLFNVGLNTVRRGIRQPARGYTPLSGKQVLSSSQLRVAEKAIFPRV